MTLVINDQDTCPVCEAYYQTDGYCANGHLRQGPIYLVTIELPGLPVIRFWTERQIAREFPELAHIVGHLEFSKLVTFTSDGTKVIIQPQE